MNSRRETREERRGASSTHPPRIVDRTQLFPGTVDDGEDERDRFRDVSRRYVGRDSPTARQSTSLLSFGCLKLIIRSWLARERAVSERVTFFGARESLGEDFPSERNENRIRRRS